MAMNAETCSWLIICILLAVFQQDLVSLSATIRTMVWLSLSGFQRPVFASVFVRIVSIGRGQTGD